jgi:DNA repair protein RecN (Recombination protein N)
VEFWVCTNPGHPAGAADEGRLGGERARFMLALKVVIADRGSAPSLVFDEIDTGASRCLPAFCEMPHIVVD